MQALLLNFPSACETIILNSIKPSYPIEAKIKVRAHTDVFKRILICFQYIFRYVVRIVYDGEVKSPKSDELKTCNKLSNLI